MMTHDSSGPSAHNKRLSLAGRLLRRVLEICRWLAIAVLVVQIGLILMMTCLFMWLLWFYIGIAAVSVVFPCVFIAVRRRRGQSLAALLASAKWSVIDVVLTGFLLFYSGLIVPGYKTFLAGYWLHVKIWLDPAQVRQWAAAKQAAADRTGRISYQHWPSSLQKAASSPGDLTVDSQRQRIILVESERRGHWGIEIAPMESNAPAEHYVIDSSGAVRCVFKVTDGAWVWYEQEKF